MSKYTITLHGHLHKLWDKATVIFAETPAAAIKLFLNQCRPLQPSINRPRWRVKVQDFADPRDLFKSSLDRELHIYPALMGGKGGGFFQIVLGVVLVAAAVFAPELFPLTGFITANSVFSFGLSLFLGGLISVLSPAPKRDNFGDLAADPEASKYLPANQNTVAIGTRIPIGYGKFRIAGHYLSFDIQAKDVDLTGA